MVKRNALGKGLGAIFTDLVDTASPKSPFIICGIEELRPNKFQPRRSFEEGGIKNLASSIKENGIIQPIIVRRAKEGYEIIAGERRWRAAQEAGLQEIPIIIREAADIHLAEISLIENIQREELNAIEESEAYHTLVKEFHLSHEEISHRVGKDRSTIANSLRLLKLPQKVKDAVIKKEISSGHARALLSLDSVSLQTQLLNDIIQKKLSVREAERAIKKMMSSHKEAGYRNKDENIKNLENVLSKKMMARVTIREKKRGGAIEIKFLSRNELDRIVHSLLSTLNE
ncbi:MAG: ParB/RepB/Spo0J family partition protein [Syntrophales bacterium]|jgi:ParB family chromosome partitioning protein|nr:ParB/RepB/Spo0J family partition protein [Syntrophales bacterium]MDY0044532.1 ParB/RepB/Spo0J family partition protein [Syntrophales bacterium]